MREDLSVSQNPLYHNLWLPATRLLVKEVVRFSTRVLFTIINFILIGSVELSSSTLSFCRVDEVAMAIKDRCGCCECFFYIAPRDGVGR